MTERVWCDGFFVNRHSDLMTDEDRKEILAQNIWMATFGEMKLLPLWVAWATDNPSMADALRKQAGDMIAEAKKHPHTSLGWLMQHGQ